MASKGTIGAKLVLEGESQYKQALKQIKQAQTELRSEMKLCQTEFKNSQNTITALQSKYDILTKQVETSQKKYDLYSDALKKAQKYQEDSAKSVDEYTKKLEEEKSKLQALEQTSGATNEQLEEQRKIVDDTAKSLESANSKYEQASKKVIDYQTSVNYAKAELTEFKTEQAKTADYIDEAEKSADKCAKTIDEYGNEVKDASEQTNIFGDVLKANLTSEVIINGLKTMVNGIKEIATACIESGMQFEASMSNVKALSGATQTEFEALSEKAQEMGASTMFSASQAADAFSYMALAGWDAEQMLEGIQPVLSLAAAANMDLAEASDIVTDYLTAFGLEAKDAAKFSDQLAYAMSNSNTNVTQLGEAYKNCAATASSLGYSVEDVTAVLMTMANAGVKGGEAGTGLSTIMVRLATNTKEAADTLAEYGVYVYDTEGNMNSLSDILEGLEHVWADLTDQQQANIAKIIAGTNQYSKLQTIMKGVSETAQEGGMSFYDYSEALKSCDGAAENMANTMQDNLKGKITILQSALEGLQIATYDVFDEGLKKGVDSATDAVSRLTNSVKSGDLHTSLNRIGDSSEKLMTTTADWAENELPEIIDGFADIIDNADKIIPLIEGIVAGFLTFKAATAAVEVVSAAMDMYAIATSTATEAQIGLNLAAEANPYILLATAIVGVVVAVEKWTEACYNQASTLSDIARESKNLASETEALNASIRNGIDARKDEMNTFETSASVAHDLANRLGELQQAYAGGSDNMTEMKSIVDQLNQIMPDLNLTIDEQTGALNMSTKAINDNIDALMKQAKVEAAREHLVEIAKQQYEAEMQLKEVNEQIAEQVERTNEAYDQYMEDAQKHVDMNGNLVEVENEYTLQLQNERDALAELGAQRQETSETIQQLADDYAATTDYINENTNALTENSNAYEENEGAVSEATEAEIRALDALKEAYAEAYDEAYKSIQSQVGLFEELKVQSDLTVSQMTTNLESQTKVFNQYSEDLEKAAKLANSGSSPEFQEILSNIETMGINGAGYLHELVTAAESNSSEFNALMGAWADMQDAKDRMATSMAEFETGFSEGTDSIIEAQGNFNDDFNGQTEQLITDTENAVDEATDNVETAVEESLDTVQQTIVTKDPEVAKAAEDLAKNANEAVSSTMSADVWRQYGENAVQGLIEGLNSKLADLKAKAEEVGKVANSAVSGPKGLNEHSPSKTWRKYGQYAVEGLELGFRDEMASAQNVIYDMVEGFNSVVDYGSQRNDQLGTSPNAYEYAKLYNNTNTAEMGILNKIQDVLNEYLPKVGTGCVYLDKNTLVGKLSPAIDSQLGSMQMAAQRGI